MPPAPAGIGGWLYLLAFGLCLTPIRLGAEVLRGLVSLEAKTWAAVTTPGTRVYHPLFGPLIVGEIVVNAALLIAALVLLYLFFAKQRLFPLVMIVFLIARVAFQVADLSVALMIPATAARIGGAAYGGVAGGILVAVVWVPYLIRSQRVEATFIR